MLIMCLNFCKWFVLNRIGQCLTIWQEETKPSSDLYEDFFDFALNQINPVWSTEDLVMLHQLFTDWQFLQYPNATVSSRTSRGYWYSSPITHLINTNPNDEGYFAKIFRLSFVLDSLISFLFSGSILVFDFFVRFFRLSIYFIFQNKQIQILVLE